MTFLDELPRPRKRYERRRMVNIRGWTQKQIRQGKTSKSAPVSKARKGTRRGAMAEINRKKRRAAYDRRRKLKARIEQEIDAKARELQELDEQLKKREEILDLSKKAPSVKEMRGAVAALFKSENLDPIKEMIKMVKRSGKYALPPQQRAMLLKELAQYQAPKPKSVDIQADLDHNVTVGLVDFRGISKAMVDVSRPELEEGDYAEFEAEEAQEQ